MNAITNYLKAHVATVAAVGAWLSAALKDGHIDGNEWYGLLIAVIGGGVVAAVPNRRSAKRRVARDAGFTVVGLLLALLVVAVVLPLAFAAGHVWLWLLLLLLLVIWL